MSVDWASFTAASAAAGGALIGLAVALLLLVNGRVAGVSGIVGGVLRPRRGDVGWRLAFVAGLVAAPIAYTLVRTMPPIGFDVSMPSIGLCGPSRGHRHAVRGGLHERPRHLRHFAAVASVHRGNALLHGRRNRHRFRDPARAAMSAFAAFASGLLFGTGLLVSGMADPAKVKAFLDVTGRFDPSLAVVMASALAVAFVAYAIAKRRSASFTGRAFDLPASRSSMRACSAVRLYSALAGASQAFAPDRRSLLGAGHAGGLVFVVAMLGGMVAFEVVERRGRAKLVPVAEAA